MRIRLLLIVSIFIYVYSLFVETEERRTLLGKEAYNIYGELLYYKAP